MEIDNSALHKVSRLHYHPDETIIKGGDWGISIYEVLEGSVEVFIEVQGQETQLAVLGPGELLGEMAALSGGKEPRSASVRAREETILESWHPSMLASEYHDMPLIFQRIMDQIIKRNRVMDKVLAKWEIKKRDDKISDDKDNLWASKRRVYRKKVNIACAYRPDDPGIKWTFRGKIKDISRTGVRIEISRQNELAYSHKPGEKFYIEFTVPPGNRIKVVAKLVRNYKTADSKALNIGMVFEEVPADSKKHIGFLLMA